MLLSMSATINAIDLFCGTGGLSLGLQDAGVNVKAGVDCEIKCQHPYSHNIGATFLHRSVTEVSGVELEEYWPDGGVRLLAGCAPCQPFSSQRRGHAPEKDKNWPLLRSFGRLVEETLPELVTMENVPRLLNNSMFTEFVETLERTGYHVVYGVLYGPDFGLAQTRKRLILLASRLGPISMPTPTHSKEEYVGAMEVIGKLPPLRDGEHDPHDDLHFCRKLSEINLQRARHSLPGGTWRDWPEKLLAECQKRDTTTSFGSFYGRMRADEPAPTITTQCYNTGAGRFTHPTQDRGLSLREAALLQGFPPSFVFTSPDEPITLTHVGRLIGNAVPPAFGKAVGQAFIHHLEDMARNSGGERAEAILSA